MMVGKLPVPTSWSVFSHFPASLFSEWLAILQEQHSINPRSLSPVDSPQQSARWEDFQMRQYPRFSKNLNVSLVTQIARLPRESHYSNNKA